MLGIAANLDNLGLGLAYGIRRIKIPFGSNLVIAILSGIATILSGFVGHLLLQVLPSFVGNVLGGGIVSIVGVWTLVSYYRDKNKGMVLPSPSKELVGQKLQSIFDNPYKADTDYSGHISIKEALLLGAALAINCLATGLGAGMTGLNVICLTISTMFFSLLTIATGVYTGEKYLNLHLGDKATLVAGILLMLIGIFEMLV
jgi:putative sporulation protein YtaF